MEGERSEERKREAKKMRIAVALDDSDGSFYALQWALDHLVDGKGKEEVKEPELESGMVTLIHVQQPIQPLIYPIGPAGAAFYPMGSLLESMKKASAQHSAAILSRAQQMCKSKTQIKAETLILDGDPKDMICEVMEQVAPDVLVLGSRGLGKIKRAFLGSVSDYCVHHAKCPVLIVKPPRETAAPKPKGESE